MGQAAEGPDLETIGKAVRKLPDQVLDFSQPVPSETQEGVPSFDHFVRDTLRSTLATVLAARGMGPEDMTRFCRAIKDGMEPDEALELVGAKR